MPPQTPQQNPITPSPKKKEARLLMLTGVSLALFALVLIFVQHTSLKTVPVENKNVISQNDNGADNQTSSDVKESEISSCQVDADCVPVEFKTCCVAPQKAINKKYLEEYNKHPEWQGNADPKACSVMGCPALMPTTKTSCSQNVCQLDFSNN